MSIKIALGGDVNFSRHRGNMVGLVQRKKASLFVRYRRKWTKILNSCPQSEIILLPQR